MMRPSADSEEPPPNYSGKPIHLEFFAKRVRGFGDTVRIENQHIARHIFVVSSPSTCDRFQT
jgi:hypothetical protein